MRKKIFFISSFILLGIAAFGLWHRAAHRLETTFKAYVADLQDQGWHVSYERLRVEGFPFRFRMILNDPYLSNPKITITDIKEIAFTASFWNWSQISFAILDKITIIYNSALENKPYFELTGQHCIGTGDLQSKGLDWPLKMKMETVTFKTDSLQGTADSFYLENFTPQTPTLFRGKAVAENIAFSPDFKLPFFNKADQISLIFRFESPQSLNFSSEKPFLKIIAQALAVEGATIELEEANFRKDNFWSHSTGTLSLDTHYQPLAALSTRIHHIDAVLKEMITHAILPSKTVKMIKLFLFPLQKTSEDSFSVHQIPLSLQQGRLSLGPFPLLSFPPFKTDILK